jgi:P27 family predicted phage terminase small subunit
MKGRPPKPPRLHLLQGTHRKDRHGPADKELPAVKLTKNLPPPDFLDEFGKGVWGPAVEHLENNGLLADVDEHLLGLYCLWISIARQCAMELEADGALSVGSQRGGKRKHPCISTLKDAIECTTKLGALFGFGPVSRARLLQVAPGSGRPPKYSSLLD